MSNSQTVKLKETQTTQCPYCGKAYIRVNIHISRAHPQAQRQNLTNRQPKTKYNEVNDLDIRDQNHSEQDEQNSSSNEEGPLDQYKEGLQHWNRQFLQELNDQEFNTSVEKFATFLSQSIYLLPGPKHPASKYFEARRARRNANLQTTYQNRTNPQRASKREKEKRKNKYKYEEIQFLYYNQRRKAIRKILSDESRACKCNIQNISDHFSSLFSVPNNCTRDTYDSLVTNAEEFEINNTFEDKICKEEIIQAVKKMAVDTDPGPDKVLVRAIKDDLALNIISNIASRMIRTGHVPPIFKKARTVLLYKNGDEMDLSNWRPITICSVLRRVIERALDIKLRRYITFCEHQRGFTRSPGCLINTSILSSILKCAKHKKNDVSIVFLDIRKAFDNIGHNHLKKALNSTAAPAKLTELILALQEDNTTQIHVNNMKTKPIQLLRGVIQGSPLSPTLYNVSTDHILRELSEKEITNKYGYNLVNGLPPITVLGFADDTVIIGKNQSSVVELTRMALQRFNEIGLEINLEKSIAITIKKGKLSGNKLEILDDLNIKSISDHECIKYLGLTFADVMIFDSCKILTKLKNKLDMLCSSPWLHPDQKFSILSSSICPILMYNFICIPSEKIPARFLQDADKMIKTALKEILSLPADTPDAMLYADKKFKGLGLFRATWEAVLQQINSCQLLINSQNPYINNTRNLDKEQASSLAQLPLENADINIGALKNKKGKIDSHKVRQVLRQQEYHKWCQLPQKGKGACLYGEFTPANSWVKHHEGLSSTEWRDALKMTCNVAPVRAIPGRTQDNNRCRRCHSEIETLSHVLGSCPFGETLRNSRHHKIRSTIARALQKNGYTTYEEVHGIAENGSVRRIDIIAFKPGASEGYIIDPTIRFESHIGQAEEVDAEKKCIYEPTIPYYKTSYKLLDIEVIGLMVGARGTITKHFVSFWKRFNLPSATLQDIALETLKRSLQILRHHLYSK